MTKPAIVIVDDVAQVLQKLESDLQHKYGDHFRIITTTSGRQALDRLKAMSLQNEQVALLLADEQMLPATSLFIFIGAEPHTEWLNDLVKIDEKGYVLTGPDLTRAGQPSEGWTPEREPFFLETSVPGIFAAGDMRHASIKRCASGVGEGAMAVLFVHRYLGS